MPSLIVKYNYGIIPELDKSIIELCTQNGMELFGSGCFLQEPFTRDLEFNTRKPHIAEITAHALRHLDPRLGVRVIT